jgi:periplasmic divalent cation tolerance protein
MPRQDHHQLVLCTCPDANTARRIAEHLIDARLAACVNILPGILSVYHWQGKRESTQEQLLLIKTTAAAYAQLEQAIVEQHPYELPEVITVSIENGLTHYLAWIDDSVQSPPQQ